VASIAMTQSNDVFERSVLALLSRVSGSAITVLVLVLYPGFGLILPLTLGLPTFWLALVNLLGVVIARCCLLDGWNFSCKLVTDDICWIGIRICDS
jgi:hypothetical protein